MAEQEEAFVPLADGKAIRATFGKSLFHLSSYSREFRIESSHFNGAMEYRALAKAKELDAKISKADQWDDASIGNVVGWASELWENMWTLARGTHGHNFGIKVNIEMFTSEKLMTVSGMGVSWIVDDVELSEIIDQYNRVNLSMLERFHVIRATTENLADDIRSEVGRFLAQAWEKHQLKDNDLIKDDEVAIEFRINVEVTETPEIAAKSQGVVNLKLEVLQ